MIDLLDLQKHLLAPYLSEGAFAVDFTMGNGHDTAFLSKAVGESGSVVAFDIQPDALLSTEATLRRESCPQNWRLICASHDRAEEFIRRPIDVGMFNLGYLPGVGRKQVTTARRTTLPAVERAVGMLGDGSVLLVAVYPGHEEGRLEGEELEKYFSTLSKYQFSVTKVRMVNSPDCPFFFLCEKK